MTQKSEQKEHFRTILDMDRSDWDRMTGLSVVGRGGQRSDKSGTEQVEGLTRPHSTASFKTLKGLDLTNSG